MFSYGNILIFKKLYKYLVQTCHGHIFTVISDYEKSSQYDVNLFAVKC